MNRKTIFAGVAVAAFAVPLAVTVLPALAQETAPVAPPQAVRPPIVDRMMEALRNGGDPREMMQMLQAQARGNDPRGQMQMPGRGPQGGPQGGPQAGGPQGRGNMQPPMAQNRGMPMPQLRDRGPQRPAVNPLEQFDTNKDGATTQAEINDMRAARLKQFDKNGDNKLTLEEYTQLWLDAYRRQMVDQFQHHDDDGDGLVTVDEFNEDFANMVRRADRNGDGKVDATDVARPAAPTPPAAAPQGATPNGGTPTRVPVAPGAPTTANPRAI